MRFIVRCAPILALSFLALTPAAAEDGVAADAIVFGQAAVLEGPAAALGQGMRAGINAAFDEVNKKGGVNGRKLELVSVNDGYEPDRSIAMTKKLIEEDKVFALIGPVGSGGSMCGTVRALLHRPDAGEVLTWFWSWDAPICRADRSSMARRTSSWSLSV